MPRQPAPPPRAPTPAPAGGQVVFKSGIPMAVGLLQEPLYRPLQSDIDDYQQGWETADQKMAAKNGSWWYREGYLRHEAGDPKDFIAPLSTVGATFWIGLAPLNDYEISEYHVGMARGVDATPIGDTSALTFWYRQGVADVRSGRGPQSYRSGQRPLPFPLVVDPNVVLSQQQPQLPPPVVGFLYLELLATEWTVKVPYDVAATIGQLPQGNGLIPILLTVGAKFQLLGDGPGDQRQGYGLSGPNGPIARKVARLSAQGVIQPDPRVYGLPAWVGTHLRNGQVKLLGKGELQSIGMYDALLDLFPNLYP